MISMLNYKHKIKHFNHIADYDLVVVKIVSNKFYLKEIFCSFLLQKLLRL